MYWAPFRVQAFELCRGHGLVVVKSPLHSKPLSSGFWLCEGMGHVEQEPSKHGSSFYRITGAGIGFEHCEDLRFCIRTVPKKTDTRRLGAEAHNMIIGNAEICVLPAKVHVLRR